MTALQRRIRGLLRAGPMSLQQIIDAFTPLGIKASDITRATLGLCCSREITPSREFMIGKPEEVVLTLA